MLRLTGDCSTAHRDSTVFFEVYAEFKHGDHKSILSSEEMTVEALVERSRNSEKICAFLHFDQHWRFRLTLRPPVIDLQHKSEHEHDTAPVTTIAFSLSATPIVDSSRGEFKMDILSKIDPRQKWAKLVDPLQNIVRVGTGVAEVGRAELILAS